ncbi:uncharacterized protein L3040_002001 [Drepanopeziza brunnea f. sp. 'multigermtubi']|uniref:SAFF domain-containing protein n=1 Tax=Marssonina brunnea f. sp. multigermtubi (strain MB_m1) TaxID=1072389 RepID=K1WQ06_MARBU|nr:SAFF domain-containing protein [Drepanopeziza brunnea f. sp. 'multigermtubi' MB_m1]EKD19655.1 SAFF domain-containing protein [Drepanopeziza brunnea f. sp. 'multigermtubi' MB_m1]KAJ5052247.1 hypothetical protein L3040_002001 [Drepanopeziza brunnea f. sp. 'multigermtubi']
MEALSRTEYPAILERLTPKAVSAEVNERVKRIGKLNSEVADWLAERRKVEEAYVAGLRKLARRPLPEVGQDLGVFDTPWKKIASSTDEIARSHAMLADRINNEVELQLRNFPTKNREMAEFPTIQGNLGAMAKELEDAQSKSEKLMQRGGKASAYKVEAAAARLQTASTQWNNQAPFILETLQSVDEGRLNHLRDALTQYETQEMDNLNRCQSIVESALGVMVEVDTSIEIQSWAQTVVSGKPVVERRPAGRQGFVTGNAMTGNTNMPPSIPAATNTDNRSEHSGKQEHENTESSLESKFKRGFGTIMGRRRQSISGYGRTPSPNIGFPPFGNRSLASREGRPSPSPRGSANNLRDLTAPDNRLSSLAEASSPPRSPRSQANGHKNTVNPQSQYLADSFDGTSSHAPNGSNSSNVPDLSNVQPPPGPPPSDSVAVPEKDSEGFSVPVTMNDPISQAQQEAAADVEQQQYNVDIRPEPIPEQDADAQAALANVANTLKSANMPSRSTGTIRGRRDVRNTVFVPSTSKSLEVSSPNSYYPPSPNLAPVGRAAALAALSTSHHASAPSVSDTISIRSGHSLTTKPITKHDEHNEPGLHASIIETISVTLESLKVKSVKIVGEIALIHNKISDDTSVPAKETIRIDNFPNMEAIAEDKTFVHRLDEQKPDEFMIDLAHVSAKPSIAFTYRVHVDEQNMEAQAPIQFRPGWKTDGNKLLMVFHYGLNPAFSSQPVAFKNVVLIAYYTGARATGCQSRPNGIHSAANSLIYWRLGDVTLDSTTQKVICKLSGVEGAMPEPGHLEIRWDMISPVDLPFSSGISISKLDLGEGKEKVENDDPFADESIAGASPVTPESSWTVVPAMKKLASGKYEAR